MPDIGGTKGTKRAGNTASLIYDRLRTSILNGELAPGSPLSQDSIAKASKTSRGPVREALMRLHQDNLVVGRANQRFNIAPFDIADLETLLSLHLAHITLAIRVSVPFLTPQDIQSLSQSSEVMESALERDDTGEWEAAYRKFIFTIIKHTGERAVVLARQLIDDVQRYRASLRHKVPDVWYAAGAEFKQIVEAANKRDAHLASRQYAGYMSRLSSLVLAGASPAYDAARLRAYILNLEKIQDQSPGRAIADFSSGA